MQLVKTTSGDIPSRPLADEHVQHPYRWFALFIVWGGFLMSYVDRVAWNPIMEPVGATMGLKVAQLGSFVTAFYIGYVIANIVGGMVTDVVGGKYTLAASMIFLGIFTYFFSYTKTLYFGLFTQAIMGLAAGADYSAGMKIIATWFIKDRGRAMGIFTTATSLAVIIDNAIAPAFSQAYGWTHLFELLGAITVAWGVIALLTLKNNHQAPAAQQQPQSEKVKLIEMAGMLKHRNLVLLAIAGFGGMWATVGFRSWGNALMIKGHHLTQIEAGNVMVWFGIGALVAKPIFGFISDLHFVSRKYFGMFLLAVAVFMLIIFGLCSTKIQFSIVATLLGVFCFAYLPVLMAQVSDNSGKRLAGASAGWTNALWQFGSVLSPSVVGIAFQYTNSFLFALLCLAVGPILAVVALMFIVKSKPIA